MEIPLAGLIIAGAGANVPHTGGGAAVERISKLIQAIDRFAHHRANHLAIRLHHFQLHRLLRQRFSIAVAQQRVKDNRFPRAIEIARAKHKELFTEARGASDGEFRQIQRRQFKVKQRSLPVFSRQQQRRLFIGLQSNMTLAIAFRLRQRLPFGV